MEVEAEREIREYEDYVEVCVMIAVAGKKNGEASQENGLEDCEDDEREEEDEEDLNSSPLAPAEKELSFSIYSTDSLSLSVAVLSAFDEEELEDEGDADPLSDPDDDGDGDDQDSTGPCPDPVRLQSFSDEEEDELRNLRETETPSSTLQRTTENSLLSTPRPGSSTRSPSPFIEKRGFLQLKDKKSWKLRFIVLGPGSFKYYKNGPNTKPLGTVKLMSLHIFIPARCTQPYEFQLHTDSSWNKQSDWHFSAMNEKELDEWMQAFREAGHVCI